MHALAHRFRLAHWHACATNRLFVCWLGGEQGAPVATMDGASYKWLLEPPLLSASIGSSSGGSSSSSSSSSSSQTTAGSTLSPATTTSSSLSSAASANSRSDFLVEYHGELEHSDGYNRINPPVWKTPPFLYFPEGVTASKQQDTMNNTYSCLRCAHPFDAMRHQRVWDTSGLTRLMWSCLCVCCWYC